MSLPETVFTRTRQWENEGTPIRIDDGLCRVDAPDEKSNREDPGRSIDGAWVFTGDRRGAGESRGAMDLPEGAIAELRGALISEKDASIKAQSPALT